MTGHPAIRWLCAFVGVVIGAVGLSPHAAAQTNEATIDQVVSTPAIDHTAGARSVSKGQILFDQFVSPGAASASESPEDARSRSLSRQNASVFQAGSSNRAKIQQSGGANLALIYQLGVFNRAELTQRVGGNRSAIIQIGRNNTADVGLLSGGNTLNLLQFGNDNRYVLQAQTPVRPKSRRQFGNGNTLIEIGQNSMDLRVTQSGGQKMIIRNR
jgi:hypothetical protein